MQHLLFSYGESGAAKSVLTWISWPPFHRLSPLHTVRIVGEIPTPLCDHRRCRLPFKRGGGAKGPAGSHGATQSPDYCRLYVYNTKTLIKDVWSILRV